MGAGDRFIHEHRDEAVAELVVDAGLQPLGERRILEVGCGDGRVLSLFESLGGEQARMAGIDLLPEKINRAAAKLPRAELREGNAANLPWADESFDIVLQFTMLSSVLDGEERRRCSDEMRRVLKPGGAIVSYDFIWNPLNRQTRGVGISELRRLFPGATIEARRLTLVPPLARLVAPLSTTLAGTLESLPFLRTHYLALVK